MAEFQTTAEPTAAPEKARRSRPARDAYLDNAKGLLIVLVVIGHAIEQAHDTMAGNALYLLIYSFHMPAFVLITGYLSRNFKATFRGYLNIVTTLLLPYLLFQVLHRLTSTTLVDKPFSLEILVPEWTLWFLVATAWWRAVTPLLRRIPHILPIAIAISLGVGFLPELPNILALNRTLTLLPFFVLGLSLKPEYLEQIKHHFSRISGLIALAVLAALAYGIQDAVPMSTFFYNASYDQLAGITGQGILYRVATLATGVIGTCAVLAIVPTKRTWWTFLGRYSMYVYVLHALLLHVLRTFDLISWPDSAIDVSLVAVASVVLSIALASWPVRTMTKPVVQPPVQKLVDRLSTSN